MRKTLEKNITSLSHSFSELTISPHSYSLNSPSHSNFSPHSPTLLTPLYQPTLFYPSYPTLSQLFLTPTSYPLNPVIVPHFLSRHSLSFYPLTSHQFLNHISHSTLSSLSLTLFHTPLTPLFLNPFSLSPLSSLFLALLLQHSLIPLYHHSHYPTFISPIFLIPLSQPLYFSLHSFTPLSRSFTKKSNPLYHPSLAPRSPSVTQHTLIPPSSLSLSSPSHPFLSPHSYSLTHSYTPHIPIFLILSNSYSSLLHLFFPPFSLSTLSYPTLSSLSLFHLSHLTPYPTLSHYFLLI